MCPLTVRHAGPRPGRHHPAGRSSHVSDRSTSGLRRPVRESFLPAPSQAIRPDRRPSVAPGTAARIVRIPAPHPPDCQCRARGFRPTAHPRPTEATGALDALTQSPARVTASPVSPCPVNRTGRGRALKPIALARCTPRRTCARPVTRSTPYRPRDQRSCPGAPPDPPTEEKFVNPVRLLPAAHPAFENPPARPVGPAMLRRPADARRAPFASASRPSPRWGA